MTTQTPEASTAAVGRAWRVIGVIALVVAAFVVGRTTAPRVVVAAGPASASKPAAATPGQISDGVWIVGSDVQPGTYRTTGASSSYCMWSRHSSAAGGPMDAILASDGSRSGQLLVTIEAGDKLFRTHGCAPFTKVG